MKHRPLALTVLVALTLVGCAPGLPDDARPSTPATTPSATASAEAPTPVERTTLVVGAESLSWASDAGTEVVDLRDGDGLLALLEALTGTAAPIGTYDEMRQSTRYEWDAVTVDVWDSGPCFLTFTAAAIGSAAVTTAAGLTVGSTRAQAVAAGAMDEWDQDGDGVADYLTVDPIAVDDAESLVHPGTPGSVYVVLKMNGDTVAALTTPGNDFSDI